MTCDPKRYFPPESRDLRGESISPQESYFLHRNRYTSPDCKIFFFFLHHHFAGLLQKPLRLMTGTLLWLSRRASVAPRLHGSYAGSTVLAPYGCYGGLLQYRMFIAEELLETV